MFMTRKHNISHLLAVKKEREREREREREKEISENRRSKIGHTNIHNFTT